MTDMYEGNDDLYDDGDEQAYEDDRRAQDAVDDAKYDAMTPEQDEPPEGYHERPTHHELAEDLLMRSDAQADATEAQLRATQAMTRAVLAVADELAQLRGALAVTAPQSPDPWARTPLKSPADPAERAAWLRTLFFGSILRDRSGHAWERNTGCEAGGGGQRKFPTLIYALSGQEYELTDGHRHLDHLAEFAPFTVLDLGAPF